MSLQTDPLPTFDDIETALDLKAWWTRGEAGAAPEELERSITIHS